MKLSAQPHRGVVAWQSLAQAVGSLTRTSPRPDVAQKRARDPETVWGPLGRHGAHEHRTSCRTSVRQRRLPEGHTRPTITIGATRLPLTNCFVSGQHLSKVSAKTTATSWPDT